MYRAIILCTALVTPGRTSLPTVAVPPGLSVSEELSLTQGDKTPGITRVGKARAAKMWKELPTTPGMQRVSCEEGLCTVMFDPSMWSQMTYDLKRDVTAMLGIGLAYGRKTEIRDMMTNKKLAQYSTGTDRTRVE